MAVPPSTAPPPRATVCFASNAIAHYRERFFELLRARLGREGIVLEVIHGIDYQGHNISGHIGWAQGVPLRSFRSFTWLSLWKPSATADLIIVPQVLKHLWIYPLMARRWRGRQKVALWGHGKVFSAVPESRVAGWLKRVVSRRCDWWFAYTERSARVVRDDIGFPAEKITVVNNAVDSAALAAARGRLGDRDLNTLRDELGIRSPHVGIFVGGMYHLRHHTKRLPFLIESCHEIRKRVADFEMIFIGGGPEQGIVEAAAARSPWMHYLGVKKGPAAVPYWALAKVCLNPGLVGLSILDSLALGVPMITADVPYHSPEIAYLTPGVNGVMIDDGGDPAVYAAAVVELMMDDARREAMAEAGRGTARHITNEAMVESFTDGILKVLALPGLT